MRTLPGCFLILLFILGGPSVIGQNCGIVTGFSVDETDNMDGTCTYNFMVDYAVTSGGEKSVEISIACGTTIFVDATCLAISGSISVPYGPFTVTCCTSAISINWSGHTTANCGGTSCSSGITVPVDLLDFKAESSHGGNLLKWNTTNEINNVGFDIEHSTDDLNYSFVDHVPATSQPQEINNYEYFHQVKSENMSFYRLVQIDFDGTKTFSEKVVLTNDTHDGILKVFPNPASTEININGALNGKIKLIDMMGRIHFEGEKREKEQNISLTGIPSGLYYFVIQNTGESEIIPLIVH